MKQQKAILTFWRDIEIFNLPDLPADAKLFKSGSTLPWHIPHEPEKDLIWQHIVYFGKLTKKEVTDSIEEAINYSPDKDDNWTEKVSGNTCMAAMIIDEYGHSNQDNGYIQAAYVHGLKCLQNKLSLSTIEAELEKEQELFKDRFPVNEDAPNKKEMQTTIINWSHLIKEIRVLNSLSVEGLVAGQDILIKSFRISKHAKPDIAFLNSFYQKDLNKLIDAQGKWGKGLQQFLSINTAAIPKIDLLNDAAAFWDAIDPKYLPAGRWPSNPQFGLYSAQFGAVNTCLAEFKNKNGIIGVNGPPGTGKTTLLSDIVAEVIVNRASKLMRGNIQTIFGKGVKIDKGEDFAYYYPPDAKLFENAGIVVASNNNTAVENISKELPSVKKIDLDSFPKADYFGELATELIPGESWGVLAAALGNAENKNAFKNKFWYAGEKRDGFAKLLVAAYAKNNDQTPRYLGLYEQAAAELKELHLQFDTFKLKAEKFHFSFPRYLQDQVLLSEEETNLSLQQTAFSSLNEEKLIAESLVRTINTRIFSLQESIKLHSSIKPSWFAFQQLFKTVSFKSWKAAEELYFSELASQTKELIEAQQSFDSVLKRIKKAEKEIEDTTQRLQQVNNRLAAYQRLKEELHREYGIDFANIPDEELLDQYHSDKAKFHKASPWSSVKINTLRSNIFLLSLKLHEYAILSNAKPFYNNLKLFMDYLDGKIQISEVLAEILWKTFFFCIPVVSTTLASVSKLFGALGKESIGWLLIDEAGQAVPLSAAGLINRAQKSVIIGDPFQIEPVVTLNHQLIKMLGAGHKTDPLWSPLHNSAQTLADRVTSKGAYISNSLGEQSWTGFPLRTHRRCNNPMFAIANQIAYSKQMVKAEADVEFECALGNSAWFDVAGTTIENRHVIVEEIDFLKEKIALLKDHPSDIFVISPFKSVADQCSAAFRYSPKVKCGTIHTFQGKEADIVFLILGSDPAKPGARTWASRKPNMLNVALTRAKRRFYVIGNKKLWKGNNFFSILAMEL
ncbi:ATP-binding protein [Pedobacter sp. L105]|uniref:DEAD/DEAH box helicase n=1 Tax=Pedobacter sp. L105 TaxID=1641871 RepID=UPI00131AF12B|nr:AAA domain-containing protein [Pedobacter sp. L105]